MLGNALAKLHEDNPVPTRIEAAAILRAYSEKAVPLPVQVAAQWYGPGGRYWVLMWLVCGWKAEGDKFYGDNNIAWGLPLSTAEAEVFWTELGDLAAASDAWALADGRDVAPPKVDVAALLNRKVDWRKFPGLAPLWDVKRSSSTALVNLLREAYKQLQEWRKKRQVPAPLKPLLPQPKGDGGGLGLLLAVLAILAGSRSSSRRRRS